MSLVALGLGVAGSVAQGIGASRSAEKAAEEQRRRTDQGLGILWGGRQSALKRGEKSARFAQLGTDDAIATRSRVLRLGDDALRSEVTRLIEDRERAQAANSQNLVSRGLFGSTVATNQGRQVDFMADRALGDASARFAMDRQRVDLAASGAVQQGFMNQAGVHDRTTTLVAGMDAQRAAIAAGANVPRTPDMLETFGSTLGSAAGALNQYEQGQRQDKIIAGQQQFLGQMAASNLLGNFKGLFS